MRTNSSHDGGGGGSGGNCSQAIPANTGADECTIHGTKYYNKINPVGPVDLNALIAAWKCFIAKLNKRG
jgi:hypothetical protein